MLLIYHLSSGCPAFLWGEPHVQGLQWKRNAVKMKAGGHENTSGTHTVQAADEACWFGFMFLIVFQQCSRHVPRLKLLSPQTSKLSTKQNKPPSTSCSLEGVLCCYKHMCHLCFCFKKIKNSKPCLTSPPVRYQPSWVSAASSIILTWWSWFWSFWKADWTDRSHNTLLFKGMQRCSKDPRHSRGTELTAHRKDHSEPWSVAFGKV